MLLYLRKNTNNLLNNNKIPLLTTVKNLLETLLSLLTQRNTELPFWLDAKHIHIKYTHLRQPCDMGFPHSIRKSFAPNNLSTALFSSHLSCLNLFVLFILSSPIPSTTEGLIQRLPSHLPHYLIVLKCDSPANSPFIVPEPGVGGHTHPIPFSSTSVYSQPAELGFLPAARFLGWAS